jgi:hypothetical protein
MRKVPPAVAEALKSAHGHLGNEIKLTQIYFVPRDRRIVLQRGFALLATIIDWRIGFFQRATCGVCDDLWPSFIGFTESDGVGVARSAVAAEGFVEFFGNVRATHHYGHTNGANRISHAIGLRNHSCHRADADKADILFAYVSRDAFLVHGLGIAVDQENFVALGSKRLKEKHPQMRHEVARDPIVWVIEQNPHRFFLQSKVLLCHAIRRVKDRKIAMPGTAGGEPSG